MNDEIEGLNSAEYGNRLLDDVNSLSVDPIAFLLGRGFVEAGFRAKDREINRRITIMRAYAREKICARIKEIRSKKEK